jgi:hypothetical protein
LTDKKGIAKIPFFRMTALRDAVQKSQFDPKLGQLDRFFF